MKFLGTLTILGAFLAASAPFASATPIQLGSYASHNGSAGGDANSAMQLVGVEHTSGTPTGLGGLGTPGSSATFTLSPGTVWASALSNSTWVGIATSAEPGGSANPGYGYYEFQTTFDATAGTYSGILNVLADDTVEVVLNGDWADPLIDFGALGSDSTCADNATGCLTTTETSLLLTDLSLNSTNTLDFVVEQAGEVAGSPGTDPSGLDFDATLTPTNECLTPTPEPGTLFLLGTGLLGAAGMARRKFASKFV